jgi:hypothetical protein
MTIRRNTIGSEILRHGCFIWRDRIVVLESNLPFPSYNPDG